jgi:hypothetical protein
VAEDQRRRSSRRTAVPHNFIKTNPYTPNTATGLEKPKPELRKPDDVRVICKKHTGEFESLLFDAETQPQFAYVLFKEGDVRAIIGELGGGEIVGQYFDSTEVKSVTS